MSYWFSFLLPWLLVLWFLQGLARWLRIPWHDWRGLIGAGLVSAAIMVLPVKGIPAGRWMAGLNLPPSIPLLALLAGRVWQNAFSTEIFRAADSKVAWVFGAIAGTALYPMALGLGSFDPYSSPGAMTVLIPAVAVITLWLIWRRNRFGLLLLLSIVGYDLNWLESRNYWDYLVDPVYWLLSLAFLISELVKRRTPQSPPVPDKPECALPIAK